MDVQRPARRIGSKTISQALEKFIVPLIASICSVISFRVLWNTLGRDETMAENLIAVKRRQLELLLPKHANTWIIWSCVTGIEVKRTQPRRERPVSENEGSQNEAEEKADEFDIKPGISFWIVVDVPKQKIKHLENEFAKVMLSSGLDIENFKPIKARNKDDMTAYYAATLCQANKDWNSSYAQRLARDGTQDYTSSCIHARTGNNTLNISS